MRGRAVPKKKKKPFSFFSKFSQGWKVQRRVISYPLISYNFFRSPNATAFVMYTSCCSRRQSFASVIVMFRTEPNNSLLKKRKKKIPAPVVTALLLFWVRLAESSSSSSVWCSVISLGMKVTDFLPSSKTSLTLLGVQEPRRSLEISGI